MMAASTELPRSLSYLTTPSGRITLMARRRGSCLLEGYFLIALVMAFLLSLRWGFRWGYTWHGTGGALVGLLLGVAVFAAGLAAVYYTIAFLEWAGGRLRHSRQPQPAGKVRSQWADALFEIAAFVGLTAFIIWSTAIPLRDFPRTAHPRPHPPSRGLLSYLGEFLGVAGLVGLFILSLYACRWIEVRRRQRRGQPPLKEDQFPEWAGVVSAGILGAGLVAGVVAFEGAPPWTLFWVAGGGALLMMGLMWGVMVAREPSHHPGLVGWLKPVRFVGAKILGVGFLVALAAVWIVPRGAHEAELVGPVLASLAFFALFVRLTLADGLSVRQFVAGELTGWNERLARRAEVTAAASGWLLLAILVASWGWTFITGK